MKSWIDIDSLNLSVHQKSEIAKATAGPVGILTGYPGTGKSRSVTEILRQFKGYSVCLAPTGIAASRIRQLSPSVNSSTIHSALEPSKCGHGGSVWSFNRNRSNPLDCELAIVDESSMLSQSLFCDLLQAVKKGTKLLFCGDPEQLQPVGAGRPFIDMINAGLPHGHLEEIWRFSGRVAKVCEAIRLEKVWESSPKLDLENKDFPENFLHIECPSASIPKKIQAFVQQFIERGYPISDIHVVTPCNASGDLSRERINRLMQQWFNPNGEIVLDASEAKCGFRVGDKIMNLENSYIKLYGTTDDDDVTNSTYVANGDIGIVLGVGTNNKKGKISIICQMANGLVVVFDSVRFRECVTLAYCSTCHKVQGNQMPIVITVADDSHGARMVTDRSWFFTAFSRQSKCGISLGPKSAIVNACKVARIEHRTTFLSETISEFHRKLLQGA